MVSRRAAPVHRFQFPAMYQTSQAATNRNITRNAGKIQRHRRSSVASAGGGASGRGAGASVTRLLQVEIRELANEWDESSRGAGDLAGAAGRVHVARSSDGRGPCGAPESSKLFLQPFPIFRLFSPSFSKQSFGRFQGVASLVIERRRPMGCVIMRLSPPAPALSARASDAADRASRRRPTARRRRARLRRRRRSLGRGRSPPTRARISR